MDQRAKWYPGRENGMEECILVIGISYQVEKDDQNDGIACVHWGQVLLQCLEKSREHMRCSKVSYRVKKLKELESYR